MGTLVQDLKYGLRMLARSPGFTAVAVLTLALGIGANTAIFSLIDAVMLEALPVQDPKQLVLVNWVAAQWPQGLFHGYSTGVCPEVSGGASGCSFSYPLFEQMRTKSRAFSHLFAFAGFGRPNFIVNGQAGLAEGEFVSGDYFSGLGVELILGRPITETDDKPGAPAVTVISYSFWQKRFGGDLGIIGKTVTVNGVPSIVIGIAPPEFFGVTEGQPRDFWVPFAAQPLAEAGWAFRGKRAIEDADNWWLAVMGRLKPGVAREQGQAELDVAFHQALAAIPTSAAKPANFPRIYLSSGSRGIEMLRAFYSKPLLILMAIVGLVLLIACANVANLLLARSAARQREIAVRLALGAGRSRVVLQLLTETVLLALIGGAAGLVLAFGGSHALIATMSFVGEPIRIDVHADLRVLGFTTAVSALTGILFGMAPALLGTRVDLTPALRASGGSLIVASPTGRLRLPLGKALVVSQVSLSLLLLIGAGLFVRTLMKLEAMDPGFSRRNLLVFGVDPGKSGYKDGQVVNFYEQLLARLDSLPGVRSATMSSMALVAGGYSMRDIYIEGYTPRSDQDTSVYALDVGPKFFETMGIPLLLGHTITTYEAETSANAAVVNESFARQYFAGRNPVGKGFKWEADAKTPTIEIVGLVRDAKFAGLRKDAGAIIYSPISLDPEKVPVSAVFEVHTTADPKGMISLVSRVLRELDPAVPIYDLKTQNEMIEGTLWEEPMFAELSSFFGALALLLACMGLYGVMAYAVERRTNEIGIRMALGARQRDVLWMVLRETLLLVLIGVAIGVPAALASVRLISSMLYAVRAIDPVTFVGASLFLASVTLLASYIPARRATKVDPMVALRYE